MMRALRTLVFVLSAAAALVAGDASAKETGGFAWLSPAHNVPGRDRIALVIGNNDYRKVKRLTNAAYDATSFAEKIRTFGYRVAFATNADRKTMNDMIVEVLGAVHPDTEVVIYYSGHGVEAAGANYLLPVDVPQLAAGEERPLRTEAISVNYLLSDLAERHAARSGSTDSGLTLVILDACRDDPFRQADTKSVGGPDGGLANLKAPSGSFVIFAAGTGARAIDKLNADDTDPNGLFTRKLLKLMDEPGLEIHSLARRLRHEVSETARLEAHFQQTPSYYDEMDGSFYFTPPATTPVPPVVGTRETPTLPETAPAPSEAVKPQDPQESRPSTSVIAPSVKLHDEDRPAAAPSKPAQRPATATLEETPEKSPPAPSPAPYRPVRPPVSHGFKPNGQSKPPAHRAVATRSVAASKPSKRCFSFNGESWCR